MSEQVYVLDADDSDALPGTVSYRCERCGSCGRVCLPVRASTLEDCLHQFQEQHARCGEREAQGSPPPEWREDDALLRALANAHAGTNVRDWIMGVATAARERLEGG